MGQPEFEWDPSGEHVCQLACDVSCGGAHHCHA